MSPFVPAVAMVMLMKTEGQWFFKMDRQCWLPSWRW